MWRRPLVAAAVLALLAGCASARGKSDYDAFARWRREPAHQTLEWSDAISKYREKLQRDGVAAARAEAAIAAVETYGEAELYDRVYSEPAEFRTEPNALLVEAVRGWRPGEALDVGMGQGRNSVYLAGLGWDVTGFDVSGEGVRKAQEAARRKGLRIRALQSSDQDFQFGRERWDLIAIIYAIEKRSVRRAREALKPGGLIVVESGHSSVSGAPFEYESGELEKIFEGFRILRNQEVAAEPDWSNKSPIRLVRFIAEKPGGRSR